MPAGRSVTFPRVVELLKEKTSKIGQRAVARESGLTLKAIQRYLGGNSEPTQASLEKLSAYFGESVAELRGENDGLIEAVNDLRLIDKHIARFYGDTYLDLWNEIIILRPEVAESLLDNLKEKRILSEQIDGNK